MPVSSSTMNENSAISPSRNDQWSGKTLLRIPRSGVATWNRSSTSLRGLAGQGRYVDLSALHGRSQKSGPTVACVVRLCHEVALFVDARAATAAGCRLAGPKIGLALSVIRNCDWWHGQSSRLVCCS